VAGPYVYVAGQRSGLYIMRRPCRATASLSHATVQLQVVTVGDTVSGRVDITNTDIDTLLVQSVRASRPELQIDTSAFTLRPDESRSLAIRFVPTTTSRDSGEVRLTSNDPIAAHGVLQVLWDARRIPVHSRLLVTSDTPPLGQAVTVNVLTDPQVRV